MAGLGSGSCRACVFGQQESAISHLSLPHPCIVQPSSCVVIHCCQVQMLSSRPQRAPVAHKQASSTRVRVIRQPFTGVRMQAHTTTTLPMPPFQPLAGAEPGSFAEGTIKQRLPAILASTLKDLDEVAGASDAAAYQEQLAQLKAEVSALREEILAGGPVTHPVTPSGPHIPAAVAASVAASQEALRIWEAHNPAPHTWLTLPWLLIECVMYVRLAVAVARQPLLATQGFDMFRVAKTGGWAKCVAAAAELAQSFHTLEASLTHAPLTPAGLPSALKLALEEVVQWSLWGNKTDLSLLVDASGINPVSSASQSSNTPGAVKVQNPHVIVDEYEAVWQCVAAACKAGPCPRIDIILDNSGLELYGDLLLADFLVSQGIASKVVLHGKPFPWFVSDTLQSDLDFLLAECGPSSAVHPALLAAHKGDAAAAEKAWEPVRKLGARWADHLATGRWQYEAHTFWVTPMPFCWMSSAAPDLHADLASSQLLIFKGDLNYRKLVHDCRWPATTPWAEALQGFLPAPTLTLRTLKADVVAGLKPGQAEHLTQQDPQWLVNGKWGMVQFASRS